jgi:hypothetical protein
LRVALQKTLGVGVVWLVRLRSILGSSLRWNL